MSKVTPRMAPVLSLALLAVQLFAVTLAPKSVSAPAAHAAMVLAPVIAALALVKRASSEKAPLRTSWLALATGAIIWAVGAFDNLWQECVLGRANEMYREAMLAFVVAGVPVAFVLASEGRDASRPVARLVDALTASVLGYGYFLLTWAMVTARGAPDEAGATIMVWLLDAQNVYLLLGATVRWWASDDRDERALFRTLSQYLFLYSCVLFYNNHFVAPDPAFGPEQSSIITLVFALLGVLALRPAPAMPKQRPASWLTRTVRSASPVMLVGALLFVSLVLIRVDYVAGTIGILVATLGYGARTTSIHVGFLERGEHLQREWSKLETIALTDALTGLPNRRFLDAALAEAAKRVTLQAQLSILMIDIDLFKLLNDRSGHLVGDACLRDVSRALRRALGRPTDVLARYGGEEFVALLPGADAHGAVTVAERLRIAVERLALDNPASPFKVVTISIGTATTTSGSKPLELLETADAALYEAKRTGRNRVCASGATPIPLAPPAVAATAPH